MPSLQDLERFKNTFREIGGEPEALAARGETYRDQPLPQQGIDSSMAELLEPSSSAASSAFKPKVPVIDFDAPIATPADSAAFDFGALLDSIPNDLSMPELPPEPELPAGSDGPPDSSSPPDADFGDMGLPPGLLDGFADEIESERSQAPSSFEPEGGSEGDAAGDSFDLGSFDFGTGNDSFGPAPDSPPAEDAVEPFPVPEEVEAPADLAEPSFSEESVDFAPTGGAEAAPSGGDFSLPDFDLPSDFSSVPEPESAPDEAPPSGDLADFGDLGGDFSFDPGSPSDASNPTGAEPPSEFDSEAFSLFTEEGGGGLEEGPPAAEPASSRSSLDTALADMDSIGGATDAGAVGSGGADDFDFSIPDFGEAPSGPPVREAPSSDFSASTEAADMGGFGNAEDAPLDSFDTFSLDEDFVASGFGVQAQSAAESAADESLGKLEDFSLDGIDSIFGSQPAKSPQAARPAGKKKSSASSPTSAEVEEINLSEEDYRSLEKTLDSYPLNLRIACEELIAEQVLAPQDLSALVKMLVRGSPARETANKASALLGRTILIPKGFEKSSGAAFEAERSTFAYAFVHNILPVLRLFGFVVLAVASLVFLTIRFVYHPLMSSSLYKMGYSKIESHEYAMANDRFKEAGRHWRQKKWYYRYAEGFAKEGQYQLAEEKYDELIAVFNRDKKAVLDYAAMETNQIGNYRKAEQILHDNLLTFNLDDREGLLAMGDNGLAWGENDQYKGLDSAAARFESARASFARLMQKYGEQDEYLERMLRYFILTDNLKEVIPLQAHFMGEKKAKISGATLGELGGYLIDKQERENRKRGVRDASVEEIANIRKVLVLALKKDPENPESAYHMARYLSRIDKPKDEIAALERAVDLFKKSPEGAYSKRIRFHIDACRRYAAVLLKERDFITAEAQLHDGIAVYEDAVARNLLREAPQFGQLYADLGDIDYFKSGNLDMALANYNTAVGMGWNPPEIRYRQGYIAYAQGRWAEAVAHFFDTSTEVDLNRRILFSLGNALYQRGDLRLSDGYYKRLLDLLEVQRSRFPSLSVSGGPDQAELAERLMRARNNEGVVLAALAAQSGKAAYRSQALALYSESARAWDTLTRDEKTMVRSQSVNLAFLNTRGLLYPAVGYEAQIYNEIDKDVLEPSPWERLLSE